MSRKQPTTVIEPRMVSISTTPAVVHTPEFRLQAVRSWAASGLSAAKFAPSLGLKAYQLHFWKSSLGGRPPGGPAAEPDPYEEIGRLRRALAMAEEHRDILKKVLTIYAQPETGSSRTSKNSARSTT